MEFTLQVVYYRLVANAKRGQVPQKHGMLLACTMEMSSRAALRASGVLSLTSVPAAFSTRSVPKAASACGGPALAAAATSARPAWPRTWDAPEQTVSRKCRESNSHVVSVEVIFTMWPDPCGKAS